MGKHWQSDYQQGYDPFSQFKFGSIQTSLWISIMFVLSLYLWPNHRQRSHPATILRRMISIAIATCLSIFTVYLYSRYHSNKSWAQLVFSFRLRKLKIKDILWPLIITATIFLGPIVDDLLNGRWLRISPRQWFSSTNIWIGLRSWIVAPLFEEIVFRCINCTLLSNNFSFGHNVILSGLLFGAAHLHPQLMQHVFLDMERQLLADSIIQFFYTSAFGMYAASIFMKTRSLWPAALVHIFCNMMGTPSSSIVRSGWLKTVTILGISLWLALYSRFLLERDEL